MRIENKVDIHLLKSLPVPHSAEDSMLTSHLSTEDVERKINETMKQYDNIDVISTQLILIGVTYPTLIVTYKMETDYSR